METLFEMMRQIRGDMGEKDASLVLHADLIGWLDDGAQFAADEAKCYERTTVFQAKNKIPIYRAHEVLPRYLGKVAEVWYRESRLLLMNPMPWKEVIDSTAAEPSAYFTSLTEFGLYPNPLVTNYSVGLAKFTKGSTTVSFSGGASMTTAAATFGWAIGVGAEPTKWYSIHAVSTTANTVTLLEEFEEESVESSQYVMTNAAVKVKYIGLPDRMTVWNQTGTATFVRDSNTVSLASANTQIKAGMWIGKGATSGSTIPTAWYRMKRVTDFKNIVLDQPYREASAASTGCVFSDPKPLGGTDYEAALYYAKAKCFERYGDRSEAKFWLGKRDEKIAMVKSKAALRDSANEGHTVMEYDQEDASLWGGGW